MNKKKSFVLYANYLNQIKVLSDEEAGILFKGLLEYVKYGEYPMLSGAAMMAFSFIAEQIDRDTEKYLEITEKRRKAGRASAEKRLAGKID